MKTHPLFREYLEGGEMVEWGAKTIPEGGLYALPGRRSGNGVVILGDAAGFVDVPSLKGIHYAVQSGIFAARAIYEALKNDDVSAAALARYDTLVNESFIVSDLRKTRNMRLAFKDGFYTGGFKSVAHDADRRAVPGREDRHGGRRRRAEEGGGGDGAGGADPRRLHPRRRADVQQGGRRLQVREPDPRRHPGPPHRRRRTCRRRWPRCTSASAPPASTSRTRSGNLVINAPNCIDCKATDVLGPRWTPREGGSGPKYREM
jgi:electron-transferring-flavoprotein dehydrogenase